METITVDVKGEGTHKLERSALETAGEVGSLTYTDVLTHLELSPHEVSVLVDGRPVPEDQPVEAEHMTVLRLIKGG